MTILSNILIFSFPEIEQNCTDPVPLLYSIPDSSLTASSIWTAEGADDHGPQQSRFFAQYRPYVAVGAWCPANADLESWVQADFGSEFLIQKFATKRRDLTNGHVRYMTAYKFALSRNGESFDFVQIANGDAKVFTGNRDVDIHVEHVIEATLATHARLYTVAYEQAVCTRWEVYACITGK